MATSSRTPWWRQQSAEDSGWGIELATAHPDDAAALSTPSKKKPSLPRTGSWRKRWRDRSASSGDSTETSSKGWGITLAADPVETAPATEEDTAATKEDLSPPTSPSRKKARRTRAESGGPEEGARAWLVAHGPNVPEKHLKELAGLAMLITGSQKKACPGIRRALVVLTKIVIVVALLMFFGLLLYMAFTIGSDRVVGEDSGATTTGKQGKKVILDQDAKREIEAGRDAILKQGEEDIKRLGISVSSIPFCDDRFEGIKRERISGKIELLLRHSAPCGDDARGPCYFAGKVCMAPTAHPSLAPTARTLAPSAVPSSAPSASPSSSPSRSPSASPSASPSPPKTGAMDAPAAPGNATAPALEPPATQPFLHDLSLLNHTTNSSDSPASDPSASASQLTTSPTVAPSKAPSGGGNRFSGCKDDGDCRSGWCAPAVNLTLAQVRDAVRGGDVDNQLTDQRCKRDHSLCENTCTKGRSCLELFLDGLSAEARIDSGAGEAGGKDEEGGEAKEYADFTCNFEAQEVVRKSSGLRCPVHRPSSGRPVAPASDDERAHARSEAIEECQACCAFLPCRTLAEEGGTLAPTHEPDESLKVLTSLDCRFDNLLIDIAGWNPHVVGIICGACMLTFLIISCVTKIRARRSWYFLRHTIWERGGIPVISKERYKEMIDGDTFRRIISETQRGALSGVILEDLSQHKLAPRQRAFEAETRSALLKKRADAHRRERDNVVMRVGTEAAARPRWVEQAFENFRNCPRMKGLLLAAESPRGPALWGGGGPLAAAGGDPDGRLRFDGMRGDTLLGLEFSQYPGCRFATAIADSWRLLEEAVSQYESTAGGTKIAPPHAAGGTPGGGNKGPGNARDLQQQQQQQQPQLSRELSIRSRKAVQMLGEEAVGSVLSYAEAARALTPGNFEGRPRARSVGRTGLTSPASDLGDSSRTSLTSWAGSDLDSPPASGSRSRASSGASSTLTQIVSKKTAPRARDRWKMVRAAATSVGSADSDEAKTAAAAASSAGRRRSSVSGSTRAAALVMEGLKREGGQSVRRYVGSLVAKLGPHGLDRDAARAYVAAVENAAYGAGCLDYWDCLAQREAFGVEGYERFLGVFSALIRSADAAKKTWVQQELQKKWRRHKLRVIERERRGIVKTPSGGGGDAGDGGGGGGGGGGERAPRRSEGGGGGIGADLPQTRRRGRSSVAAVSGVADRVRALQKSGARLSRNPTAGAVESAGRAPSIRATFASPRPAKPAAAPKRPALVRQHSGDLINRRKSLVGGGRRKSVASERGVDRSVLTPSPPLRQRDSDEESEGAVHTDEEQDEVTRGIQSAKAAIGTERSLPDTPQSAPPLRSSLLRRRPSGSAARRGPPKKRVSFGQLPVLEFRDASVSDDDDDDDSPHAGRAHGNAGSGDDNEISDGGNTSPRATLGVAGRTLSTVVSVGAREVHGLLKRGSQRVRDGLRAARHSISRTLSPPASPEHSPRPILAYHGATDDSADRFAVPDEELDEWGDELDAADAAESLRRRPSSERMLGRTSPTAAAALQRRPLSERFVDGVDILARDLSSASFGQDDAAAVPFVPETPRQPVTKPEAAATVPASMAPRSPFFGRERDVHEAAKAETDVMLDSGTVLNVNPVVSPASAAEDQGWPATGHRAVRTPRTAAEDAIAATRQRLQRYNSSELSGRGGESAKAAGRVSPMGARKHSFNIYESGEAIPDDEESVHTTLIHDDSFEEYGGEYMDGEDTSGRASEIGSAVRPRSMRFSPARDDDDELRGGGAAPDRGRGYRGRSATMDEALMNDDVRLSPTLALNY